jgi:pre-mRNA-splicing factor SYF2
MPAKARGTRSAAPSASPAPKSTPTRSRSTRSDKTADSDSTEESGVPTVSEEDEGTPEPETEDQNEEETGDESDVKVSGTEQVEVDAEEVGSGGGKLSMSERMAKMKELRNRMVCHAPIHHIPRLWAFLLSLHTLITMTVILSGHID